MISLPLGNTDSSEEHMLWTDLFASLFLFVSLMVNTQTLHIQTATDTEVKPKASSSQQGAIANITHIYLAPNGTLHLDSFTGAEATQERLAFLAHSANELVLVGSENTDGLLVFNTLRNLQTQGVTVKYLACKEALCRE